MLRSTRIHSVLVLFIVSLWSQSVKAQSIIYVDASASGANNGTSWADAYVELQPALIDAAMGAEIRVAAGTYRPDYDSQSGTYTDDRAATFQLKNGVSIYGGFPPGGGPWANRDPVGYETVLTGDIGVTGEPTDNSYHVVNSGDTGSSTKLDGVTISNGYGGDYPNHAGAGLYNYSGSPTIVECTFRDNTVEGYGHSGGAIYSYNSLGRPTIENCHFINNRAYGGGAVVCPAAEITDCVFRENVAEHNNGALSAGAKVKVRRCVFIRNTAGHGGGAAGIGSGKDTQFKSCLFYGNQALTGSGGAIDMSNSPTTITLINSVFVGNTAYRYGGAISLEGESKIINSTFVKNCAGMGGG
ncbi:MAG: hypothetical protein JSV03_16730, partial [Planctomycetota bacterium]